MRTLIKIASIICASFAVASCTSQVDIEIAKKRELLEKEREQEKASVERMKQEDNRKWELGKNSPRVECKFKQEKPFGMNANWQASFYSVNDMFAYANKQTITCKERGSEDLQINGRDVYFDRNSIHSYLLMSLSQCHIVTPEGANKAKPEKNICMINIEKGFYLWLQAASDKRISNSAFMHYVYNHGRNIDFGEWALTAYYYSPYK
ncbi:hypothetical protein [Dickeya chrysanthemi]|uniref:hypothetical protein n=1 Tax=Dickeya chrysanthemi TaxID=556 RepID=UPI000532D1C0|nr:hypothetical protein [Dickeya chrysanthemi]